MLADELSTGLFGMVEFQGELRQAALYQLRSLWAPSMLGDLDGFQGLPEAAFGAVRDWAGPAPAHGPASASDTCMALLSSGADLPPPPNKPMPVQACAAPI
jgi:hypothetical protein